MAVAFDRSAIRAALAMTDPAISSYLDLESGAVIVIDESTSMPAMEALRDQIMNGYGEQYRYIPGGNTAADEAAVVQWMESEGL